jgi:hypothetical protein
LDIVISYKDIGFFVISKIFIKKNIKILMADKKVSSGLIKQLIREEVKVRLKN